MEVTIHPSPLRGTLRAIGSKSDIHRIMICAALADRPTKIGNILHSDDIEATAGCLRALGAALSFEEKECTVVPVRPAGQPRLDCRESGSTFRFLLPVAAAVCGGASFTGAGRLPDRPIGALMDAMKSGGVSFDGERLPFRLTGRLRAGRYTLPGNISSQYISGLLMALAVTEGESEIALSTPLESAPYVDMTLHTLRLFGAEVTAARGGYRIKGHFPLRSPGEVQADGDWSNAAFFLAAGALGGETALGGLREDSLQGDRQMAGALRRFGAAVRWESGLLSVRPGTLRGCEIGLSQIPDLLPILAVTAAFAVGTTEFTGGARLRLKESDRLRTVAEMLRALGGHVTEHPDGLTVAGGGLRGGRVSGAGDHRIVMAAAIAATCCGQPVVISGAEAVNKSYPDFFRDFSALGGRVYGV